MTPEDAGCTVWLRDEGDADDDGSGTFGGVMGVGRAWELKASREIGGIRLNLEAN